MRWGIVGYGWVAQDYMAPALEQHEASVLRAVVSVREEDLQQLPRGCTGYRSLTAMLAAETLDAVYIATPNHLHARQAVACLEAGLDVLCEKPLAPTYAEACSIARAVGRTGGYFATAFDQRHHPAHRLMQAWVAEGRLGAVTQTRIDYACWLPAGWSADNWRIDPARAGGGAIIDLAPHGLDLLEVLTGQRITQLHAYQQRAVQDYAVDDGGALSVRFSGGAVGVHTVGYNRPETLPRRRLELIGTEGMLVAENTMGQDPGGHLLFVDARTGQSEVLTFANTESPFYHQVVAFTQGRRGKVPASRTIEDDLRLVQLLEEAMTKDATPWP